MPPIFLTYPRQLQCNLDHVPLGWSNFRELMFSLVLVALDLNPNWKSPESSFQLNTLNSSERSSQDPTKFSSGGNSLLLWPALGQLTDSLKESFFWSIEGQEVLWTQSGEELEFSMGTAQTCCVHFFSQSGCNILMWRKHPWEIVLAADSNTANARQDPRRPGKQWDLTVECRWLESGNTYTQQGAWGFKRRIWEKEDFVMHL